MVLLLVNSELFPKRSAVHDHDVGLVAGEALEIVAERLRHRSIEVELSWLSSPRSFGFLLLGLLDERTYSFRLRRAGAHGAPTVPAGCRPKA